MAVGYGYRRHSDVANWYNNSLKGSCVYRENTSDSWTFYALAGGAKDWAPSGQGLAGAKTGLRRAGPGGGIPFPSVP